MQRSHFRATFGSQLTRTPALARQKHALLVAFAESEGGRHEGAPARARPARGGVWLAVYAPSKKGCSGIQNFTGGLGLSLYEYCTIENSSQQPVKF